MKNISDFRVFYHPTLKKLIMELKIAFLIIVTGISGALAAPSYSQVTKISLDMKGTTVEQVMDEIEQQSEFYFIFNQKQIDVNRIVNVRAENKLITDILPELFSGTKVNYAVLDRKILLTTEPLEKEIISRESEKELQQQITGTVKDDKGTPLPGVTILVKGTTLGTISDAEGKYSFTNVPENSILTFSFVGMTTQEIPIDGRALIDIVLQEEAIGLGEVVVVGYGTSRKATLSGAISTVDGTAFQKSTVINVGQAITGRLPGVVALTPRGEPGKDGTTIRIRGLNTLNDNNPLIVVDGIPGRSLERIDPNSIESITVLKDASAAIYGAQAANGVILVQTKRGKIGKPTLIINVDHGLSQPTRLPKLTNAAEYATYLNEIDIYKGRPPRYTLEEIQKYADGSDPWKYPNTDWIDATFKKWSDQTLANINLTGGNEAMKYYVSIGGKKEGTNYKNSNHGYNQYDFRSNIDGTINKFITMGFDLAGRMENRNFPTGTAQLINTTDLYSVIIRQKPNMPAYWPNGLPGPDYSDGFNPVVMATDEPGYQNQKNYILNSNLKLSVKLPWINGMTLSGNAAVDKSFTHNKRFTKPWYLYTWDGNSYDENNIPVLVKTSRGVVDANLNESMSDGYDILVNGLLRYEKTFFGNHNVNFLAGIEKRVGKNQSLGAYRRYFVSAALDEMDLGGTSEMTNNGSSGHEARLNYFGRVNYNYKEKYLAEFLWRVDGSYIFARSGRFGFFPGISLAWRSSEEQFWKDNIPYITNFKIRASYGQTGNDRISPYQYLTTYAFAARNQNQIFNINNEYKSLYATRIPNENVTWEVANQGNIGFDASFLRDRLSLTFDYFDYLRTDILWQRSASVPKSTGLTLPSENIGKVANKGFDFELNYKDKTGDFTYSISLTGGYQKNKIIFWDESPGAPDYQKSTGYPMNSSLYYKAIGIFKDQEAVDAYPHWAGARPGDIIFEDINNDGKINANDRIRYYKSTVPTTQGGLGLNLNYKLFDLYMFFQASFGAIRYINNSAGGDFGNGFKTDYDGRWTPENIDATKPRASDRDGEYWRSNANTFFIYKSDYLRFKNFQLGYTPVALNRMLGIEGLRAYISGFNLLTITSLPNLDPEDTGGSTSMYYPVQRIVSLGLSLTF